MRLILMLIVGIAVMNIISGLVMLVKNKGRDIAILRTMGASQGSVLRVFFMCGALIGASATVAGLVIGSLFCIFIDPIQSVVEAITHTTVFSPTPISCRASPRASSGARWPSWWSGRC